MNLKIKNKIIIGLVVAFVFSLSQSSGAQVVSAVSVSSEEMIVLTNSSRIEAGLSELSVSDKLSVAAEKKARDMFANQYFDHNSPQGLTPWDFIKSAGYKYKYAGENLAIDFISANSVHRALMESSSHRANILNENYSQIGVAVVEDIFEGSKSIIVVEEFGMPLVNEEIAQIKSLQIAEEIIEKIAEEINEKIVEKDLENLQINDKKAVVNNFSKEAIKGESLNSVDNNENFQINKIEIDEQSFSQTEEDKILIQANLFQESSQYSDINFLTYTNQNIFKKIAFEKNEKEKTTCEALPDKNFENQIALDTENHTKLELLKNDSFQVFRFFQDFVNKSIVMLLALFYTVINILVIYKLVFVIIV